MTTKVTTGLVRLSYACIYEPKSNFKDQEPKFSAQFIIDKKDKKTIGLIQDAIAAETKLAFPNGKVPSNFRTPLRDGDAENEKKGDEARPEVGGSYFINASSKAGNPPGLVDLKLQKILDRDTIYSGCYVRANLGFFLYNTTGNKGIGCGLNHIQFVKDGEPLGGKGTAESAFGDGYIPSDDDAGL